MTKKSEKEAFVNINNVYLSQPTNAASWWDNVHKAWPFLYRILDLMFDLNGPPPKNMVVLNAVDDLDELHKSTQDMVKMVKSNMDKSPLDDGTITLGQYIEQLANETDETLLFWLNEAWLLGPDTPEVYAFPGWTVLTDLISERHVIFRDLTEQQLNIMDMNKDEYFMFIMEDVAAEKRKNDKWKMILQRSQILVNLNLKKRKALEKELTVVNEAETLE